MPCLSVFFKYFVGSNTIFYIGSYNFNVSNSIFWYQKSFSDELLTSNNMQ